VPHNPRVLQAQNPRLLLAHSPSSRGSSRALQQLGAREALGQACQGSPLAPSKGQWVLWALWGLVTGPWAVLVLV